MTGPQVEEQEQEQEQTENQSQGTPTSEETPNTETLESVKQAYNQALRDASIRAQQAEQEAERLRGQLNQPSQIDNEADKEMLFNEPRKLIRQEMQEQLKPLIDFQQNFSRQTELQRLVGLMEGDPRYQMIKNPQVRSAFEQAMQPVQSVNESSAIAAYYIAVGTFVSNGGNINQQAPTQNQPSPNMQTIPPHARPAAPVRLPPPANNKKRALTENERIIARVNNMTEDEYLAEMELAPEDVVKGPPKVETR